MAADEFDTPPDDPSHAAHLPHIDASFCPPHLSPRERATRVVLGSQAWVTSATVHAAVMLALGLWFLPLIFPGELDTLLVDSDVTAIESDVELQSLADAAVATGADPTLDSQTSLPLPAMLTVEPPEMDRLEIDPITKVGSELPNLDNMDGRVPGAAANNRPASSTEEVREAGDVTSAVGVVTNAIRSEIDQGHTLVVWLFDRSISMYGDRQQVAAQLIPFYKSIRGFNELREETGREFQLFNSVIAFGASSFEMQKPTTLGWKAVEAVRKVPADVSGLENILTAVQRTLLYYRGEKKRRERLILIVWTDESGDDIHKSPLRNGQPAPGTVRVPYDNLEKTIRLCRLAGAAVHVVGPSAVLGSEIGSHLWVHPGTGRRFYLPVKRGPDTSLPQRALLPYWDGAVMRRWSNAGARVADDVEWYGGPLRERVLSGFGPYGLTRLALQTGGTFTLYDRRADRGRYRLEDLRPYFPDYGTHQQYLNAMENRPLRQAVHQVAVFTRLQAQNLYQPQFGFFGSRGTTYPYSAFRVYYRQDRFRRLLGPALASQGKRALAANLIIRNALRMLEPRGVNMESEYKRESSKRWRAWYDLNRGRLLAQSVRFREYAKACDLIVSNMNRALLPSTNYLLFHLDTPLRARTKSDAEEAVRLLKRCVESNPETPWADFARWELAKPFGVNYRRSVIAPPPPPMPVPAGPAPRRVSIPRV